MIQINSNYPIQNPIIPSVIPRQTSPLLSSSHYHAALHYPKITPKQYPDHTTIQIQFFHIQYFYHFYHSDSIKNTILKIQIIILWLKIKTKQSQSKSLSFYYHLIGNFQHLKTPCFYPVFHPIFRSPFLLCSSL